MYGFIMHQSYCITSVRERFEIKTLQFNLYNTAFFLWNIDTIYCRQLEQMRQQYCFLKPFTQLHAVWHLLAGYGSYLHITYTAQARALNCQKRAILVKSWMGVKLLVDSKY